MKLKLIVLSGLTSLAISCGVTQNDASSAKTIAVTPHHGHYEVFVPEFSKAGFENEKDYLQAMMVLLNESKKVNKELAAGHSQVLELGMMPGRTFHTDIPQCRRIAEEEFGEGEEGITIYTFRFSIESPSYINNEDLGEQHGYEAIDGNEYRSYAIKVMYDKDPIKNGKVSLEGVKILKVKVLLNEPAPC